MAPDSISRPHDQDNRPVRPSYCDTRSYNVFVGQLIKRSGRNVVQPRNIHRLSIVSYHVNQSQKGRAIDGARNEATRSGSVDKAGLPILLARKTQNLIGESTSRPRVVELPFSKEIPG